eukprot:Opistho-2@88175
MHHHKITVNSRENATHKQRIPRVDSERPRSSTAISDDADASVHATQHRHSNVHDPRDCNCNTDPTDNGCESANKSLRLTNEPHDKSSDAASRHAKKDKTDSTTAEERRYCTHLLTARSKGPT